MVITGKVFSEMIVSAANQLGNNKETLDKLNVFPVPDGDTGKNMHLTMTGARNAVISADESIDAITLSGKIASATLKSARGNSGVILSQLFRGLSSELSAAGEITAASWANALKKASDTAYKAVMKPTEGTILTVARGGAEAALECVKDCDDIVAVTKAALDGAKIALDNTPELLPKLKEAGVVDAGGMGWFCILEGMYAYLSTGKMVEALEAADSSSAAAGDVTLAEEEITFGYCTEFLIEKTNTEASVEEFRNTISPLGDCMLVIEDFDVVKVHIHTDNPGTVLQAALKLGGLINIKIDNMRYQHSENLREEMQAAPAEKVPYAMIAVSSGEGFSEIFRELDVAKIIEGGQTMNPSAGDIADGILAVNADVVYILPNNSNIILAAETAADLVDCDVRVIPTKTVPQGITAAISFNPDASADENAAAMTEAAQAVKTGLVTYAVRDTSSNGLEIKEGNLIGLSDKKIVSTGTDMQEVISILAGELCDDSVSVITVYYGSDVSEADATAISDMLTKKFPDCDVMLQNGGQPVYYYTISAE
ncbi:MAG: DAK2 domain-containing protein [Clostridia bacterium]|nr:DAK2 domain-containing protein [Clostridia bacterium]